MSYKNRLKNKTEETKNTKKNGKEKGKEKVKVKVKGKGKGKTKVSNIKSKKEEDIDINPPSDSDEYGYLADYQSDHEIEAVLNMHLGFMTNIYIAPPICNKCPKKTFDWLNVQVHNRIIIPGPGDTEYEYVYG